MSRRLRGHSDVDLDSDARTDFIWREKSIGRENNVRGSGEPGIDACVSGTLFEPLWVPGDWVARSLEVCCRIGALPERSSFTGLLTSWSEDKAATSEELGASVIGGSIPVTCFVKVAIAR